MQWKRGKAVSENNNSSSQSNNLSMSAKRRKPNAIVASIFGSHAT
jgi:hypothetical protein